MIQIILMNCFDPINLFSNNQNIVKTGFCFSTSCSLPATVCWTCITMFPMFESQFKRNPECIQKVSVLPFLSFCLCRWFWMFVVFLVFCLSSQSRLEPPECMLLSPVLWQSSHRSVALKPASSVCVVVV